MTLLNEVRHEVISARMETASLSSTACPRCDASTRSHVLGLPQYHDSVLVSMHHDTTIALMVSLEDATVRMINDHVVIDFARIRGGRIVLDLGASGPDVIFSAQITPYGGLQMSAFEAFFYALSTELDFPVSDVAWALAQAVELDMDHGSMVERCEYPRLAAE